MEDNNLRIAPVVSIPGNGPVIIRGYFSFKDSSGKITEKEQEIQICGCGQSSDKPYCDDSHRYR